MISIVISFCLLSNMSVVDKNQICIKPEKAVLRFAEQIDSFKCLMAAQPMIAKWVSDHDKDVIILNFKCEENNQKETPI